MKKAFRDAYERELALLYERSAEFAEEFPGLADRLGGLLEHNIDPSVEGLLQGTAFLAARVQLKMDEEYRVFTEEMLEQIFPDALAPTPSVMLVRAEPEPGHKDLGGGLRFKRGASLDARFRDADQRVSCQFTLTEPLQVWPIDIARATYHGTQSALSALGAEAVPTAKAGLEIALERSNLDGGGDLPLGQLPLDDLTVHFTGPHADAVALYEQVHCQLERVSLRFLDDRGDPVCVTLDPAQVEQIGFDKGAPLFPHARRLFEGFATLREAAVFPRKFLGLRLTGLSQQWSGIGARTAQIVLEFRENRAMLATRLDAEHVTLNAAPAVNLFPETSSQTWLDDKRHELVVTPDSSPITHYEVHAITSVSAPASVGTSKVPVHPLYALPKDGTAPREALYFTARRKLRRLTGEEIRYRKFDRYRGTETFLRLYQPPANDDAPQPKRLQIRMLCSNRHLPAELPIAGSRDDFRMSEDTTVSLSCVSGPTPPRESVLELESEAPARQSHGDTYWRLMSYLMLSTYALDGGTPAERAGALREMLSLFFDLSDRVTEAQLQGITGLDTKPIVRSIRRDGGFHAARGLEVTVTFNETAFEGSGIILLGAVLDRFFAEHAAVNSFTETVIASVQRGEVKRWPPRTGHGPLL
ncbi:MAG: type VI secretion system baseplate subunit TssF [Pseudomonadota bacterium]